MNKKFVTIIGVAAVGVGAYMLWQKSQKPKSFMNVQGGPFGMGQRRCRYNSDCDYTAPVCAGVTTGQRGYCIRRSGPLSSAPF